MKLARKEVKKKLKEMQLTSKALTSGEMKKAQMLLTMDVGEGSAGQILKLLLVKLWEAIKAAVRYIKGRIGNPTSRES
jgi:hypothetical protein